MSVVQRFFFSVRENGSVEAGTVIEYPSEYTHEGTEEVWENQSRAFYKNGGWVVYDLIQLTRDTESTVLPGTEISVTATLPIDTPDSEISFVVYFNNDPIIDPTTVAVAEGQAQKAFIFEDEGYYFIHAQSEHHGVAVVGVSVYATSGSEEAEDTAGNS